MEMNWSRWFRCESSFGLLLVPAQAGIFALAEEVAQPAGPNSRRMLAVFEVKETDDLARALGRLFSASSPWRKCLEAGCCYLRYAVVPEAEERRGAATALKNWLNSRRDAAAPVVDKPLALAIAEREVEAATVTERAVDRVSRTKEYEKVFPAGF